MMGRKHREQANLFYEFRLDDMIPKGDLLRRINVFVTSVLGDLHEQLGPFYSDIGRPSIEVFILNAPLCGANYIFAAAFSRRRIRIDMGDIPGSGRARVRALG